MSNGLFIFLIIFIPTFVVAVALIVLLVVRHNAHKRFVVDKSPALKNLIQMNSKYEFRTFESRKNLYLKFDNKSNWYKTEPVDYLSRQIRNNIEPWSILIENIDFNRNLYENYKTDVKDAFKPLTQFVCIEGKKNYKKCLKIEKELFEKNKLHPILDIEVSVRLRYVSPKGKVDESKTGRFYYKELKRIVDSVSSRRVDRATYERLARGERAIISDSMRYDVLKRDNFRCVICGLSSKDGVILHVDHIIPVSKGGKSVMSNLRTLCERCNVGKSNKIE